MFQRLGTICILIYDCGTADVNSFITSRKRDAAGFNRDFFHAAAHNMEVASVFTGIALSVPFILKFCVNDAGSMEIPSPQLMLNSTALGSLARLIIFGKNL